jgi:1-acyl-sn-glycerol-3-phosphate acyltransferase
LRRIRVVIYVVRYLLVALCTIFWGTVGLVLFPIARSGQAVMFVARNWIAWMLACCGVRVESDGLENLSEPVVIMSNHQSAFDIAALIHSLPLEWRFVAKKELIWIPFFGWALAAADQVIIDRSNREKSVRSLRHAAERVRGGINVIIFPEGTRSQQESLGEFKSGGFYLAIQSGVPVIPVSVSGSSRITPKHSLRIEPGRIHVRYGKAIPTSGLTEDARTALKDQVRQAILAGLDPELQPPVSEARRRA